MNIIALAYRGEPASLVVVLEHIASAHAGKQPDTTALTLVNGQTFVVDHEWRSFQANLQRIVQQVNGHQPEAKRIIL